MGRCVARASTVTAYGEGVHSIVVLMIARRALATHCIVHGFVILYGGAERFSSPGLGFARAILPWWAWGTYFVIFGAIALGANLLRANRPHYRPYIQFALIGLLGMMLGFLFYGIGYTITGGTSPMAPLTGAPVYLTLAVLHGIGCVSLQQALRGYSK